MTSCPYLPSPHKCALAKETVANSIDDVPEKGIDTIDSEWSRYRALGIVKKCMATCGKPTLAQLLTHTKKQITSLREEMGIRHCIFKIGVTSYPPRLFELYLRGGVQLHACSC